MSNPSVAHLVISSAAIGGIMVLWLEFTANAVKKVVQIANETFTDKGAEESKRQREIQEEVRRRIREIIIRREEAEAEEEDEEEEAVGKTD